MIYFFTERALVTTPLPNTVSINNNKNGLVLPPPPPLLSLLLAAELLLEIADDSCELAALSVDELFACDELLRLLEDTTADMLDDEALDSAELAEDSELAEEAELVAAGSELDDAAELLDTPFPENSCSCQGVVLPVPTIIVKETLTMSPATRPVMS